MSNISYWLRNAQILLASVSVEGYIKAQIYFAQIYFHSLNTDWALWSFTLSQAICAIFQFIWMDLQRTLSTPIWRTISSSVKANNSPSLCFFLIPKEREGERERESYIPCRIDTLCVNNILCCILKEQSSFEILQLLRTGWFSGSRWS